MINDKLYNEILEIISDRDLENSIFELPDGIELKEELDESWYDQGKFSTKRYIVEIIISGNPSGVFICQDVTRWGSYHSGYDFDFGKVYFVSKTIEVVKAVRYEQID